MPQHLAHHEANQVHSVPQCALLVFAVLVILTGRRLLALRFPLLLLQLLVKLKEVLLVLDFEQELVSDPMRSSVATIDPDAIFAASLSVNTVSTVGKWIVEPVEVLDVALGLV